MKIKFLIAALLFPVLIKAQFTNYSFDQHNYLLNRERYALPLALGGNFTGLAIGPEAQYYNPAGLAFSSGIQTINSYYYTKHFYDYNFYTQGSIAFSRKGNSFSGGYFHHAPRDVSYKALQASFDYSRKILPWLSASASVYYVNSYYVKDNKSLKINPLAFGFSLFGKKDLKKGIFRFGIAAKNLSYAPYVLSHYPYMQSENYQLSIASGASYQIAFYDTLKDNRIKEFIGLTVCSDYKYILTRYVSTYDNSHYDYPSTKYGLGLLLTLRKVVDVAGSINFISNPKQSSLRFGMGFHAEQLFRRLREKNRFNLNASIFFNERLLGTNGIQYQNLNWINTFSLGVNYNL